MQADMKRVYHSGNNQNHAFWAIEKQSWCNGIIIFSHLTLVLTAGSRNVEVATTVKMR